MLVLYWAANPCTYIHVQYTVSSTIVNILILLIMGACLPWAIPTYIQSRLAALKVLPNDLWSLDSIETRERKREKKKKFQGSEQGIRLGACVARRINTPGPYSCSCIHLQNCRVGGILQTPNCDCMYNLLRRRLIAPSSNVMIAPKRHFIQATKSDSGQPKGLCESLENSNRNLFLAFLLWEVLKRLIHTRG